jgi:hypothetical protein
LADILDDSEQRIVVVVPGDLNEVKKENTDNLWLLQLFRLTTPDLSPPGPLFRLFTFGFCTRTYKTGWLQEEKQTFREFFIEFRQKNRFLRHPYPPPLKTGMGD